MSMVFSMRTYPDRMLALEYERKRRYAKDQKGRISQRRTAPRTLHRFSVFGLLKPGTVSVVAYV